jgi:hypothetical protein
VAHTVALPPSANSPATKMRWRQVLVGGRPEMRSTWAIDDVYIERLTDEPRVLLTAGEAGGRGEGGARELIALAKFSISVEGLEAADVLVSGGLLTHITMYEGGCAAPASPCTTLAQPLHRPLTAREYLTMFPYGCSCRCSWLKGSDVRPPHCHQGPRARLHYCARACRRLH